MPSNKKPLVFPTMTVREFIRGGYKAAKSPVVVIANARILGTWHPTPQQEKS